MPASFQPPTAVIHVGFTLLWALTAVGCGSHNESPSESGKSQAVADDTPEYTESLVPPISLHDGDTLPVLHFDGTQNYEPEIADADFSSDSRAAFHAHGETVCASGCAASRHPTPKLSEGDFHKLVAEYAFGPRDETNDALESLCFYGRQTELLLNKFGGGPLSEPHLAFLREELKRTHALISFRIVDEHGAIRTHMPRTRVPLDRRHVFDMEVEDLPPLETSGTVKRVGLHHLWTRL